MGQKQKALIVGGGIGGMAAAIRLHDIGMDVDLIDVDPDWKIYGAGITITGPTLRAYKRLGMIEDIKTHGAITNGSRIFSFDGTHLQDLDEPALEEGLPATGGILRPALHKLMQSRITERNINVTLGLSVSALTNNDSGVSVGFTDGRTADYDLVVGSDSVASIVRDLAFPHMKKPQPTGQGAWRISMARPPEFDRGEFYFGHKHPCGITACSADSVYMWMLTEDPVQEFIPDDVLYDRLKASLADFGGNIGWIRDNMTRDDWINYRPLYAILQERPWHVGRIVLLGDSVHATTPHLASGAGMAVESGLVLADEIEKTGFDIETALEQYEERRYPRCSDVVKSSIAIGKMQLEGGSPEAIGKLIGEALHRLSEEY